MIPIAELISPRQDILYGSFRAAIRFSGENGTRGVFSWHLNETQSIAIDFPSQNKSQLHLTVHSPRSNPNETDTSNSSSVYTSIFDFPGEFHEYRFDWLPDRADFYVDGDWLWTAPTADLPTSQGALRLGHASAEPPLRDAVMTVGYVKAYFNTTSRDEPKAGCRNLAANDSVCVVPDQTRPPNPNGRKTHFFSTTPPEEREEVESVIGVGHYPNHGPHSDAVKAGMWNWEAAAWVLGLGVVVFAAR